MSTDAGITGVGNGSRAAPGRRREVTWEDPGVGAVLAQQMSGLDFL